LFTILCVISATKSHRERSKHRLEHHDQVRAAHRDRCRGQQPWHHDQVSATHKERRGRQQPGHHDQVPISKTAAGNYLAATVKYLEGAAGIGLGTTIKYRIQCSCVL
jgi:hypothetical protein